MGERFATWLTGRVGKRTIWWLTLLLVALGTVALGLASVIRGLDRPLLLTVSAVGLLVGWTLANRAIPAWLTMGLSLLAGMLLTLLRVGRLEQHLPALLRAGRVPWEVHPLRDLWLDLLTLLLRLREWIVALLLGEPGYDPVAVAIIWSLTLWGTAVWAAWRLRRQLHAVHALLPAGLLLALTLAYSGGDAYLLLPFLAATLFLWVMVGHDAREREWEASAVDYSLELRQDLFFTALSLSIMLTFLSALAPALSPRALTRAAQQLVGSPLGDVAPLADSFGLEQRSSTASFFDEVRAPGLPRRHLLGAGPELSEQLVMTVAGIPAEATPRWRSVSYDRYTGRGWSTSSTRIESYEAGEMTTRTTFAASQQARYEVEMNRLAGGLLYSYGTLLSLDVSYSVAWRSSSDSFGAYSEANSYTVESVAPRASMEQLRVAGNEYPRWVTGRYLTLPESMPERVTTLARDLTATEPTAFDRALAIESYLRTFPYMLDLPAPPPGRDVADYFLFELQQGYCDYYATAMVVLARAAGLPARLVVGYASGEYDEAMGRYVVTEAAAHSWPEIYFPNYGWIPFEPTAAQPATLIPAAPVEPLPTSAPASWWPSTDGGDLLRLMGRMGIVLVLMPLLALGVDRWRIHRLPTVPLIALLYQRFYRLARRIAGTVPQGATPYELTQMLATQLDDTQQAIPPQWRTLLDPILEEARWLTNLYVRSAYAEHTLAHVQRGRALQLWARLRVRLWLLWLLARLRH